MADLKKGEVAREIGGETYVLRFTTNVWCEIEEEYDISVTEYLTRLQRNPAFKDLRLLFIKSCASHELTPKQAGDLMDEMGGMMNGGLSFLQTWILEAIVASNPTAEEGTQADPLAKAQPVKKPTGTRKS